MCTWQVIGELQTLTGKPIARSSRPCVFHPESSLHRLVRSAMFPCPLAADHWSSCCLT